MPEKFWHTVNTDSTSSTYIARVPGGLLYRIEKHVYYGGVALAFVPCDLSLVEEIIKQLEKS